MMVHDVLSEPLPIATGAHWGIIDGPGLGVEVDDDAVAEAAGRYRSEGQYLPWQPYLLGREDRP
jgi:L-alanine-DL-glutamate epimerase-like enolase superfamily enzyme